MPELIKIHIDDAAVQDMLARLSARMNDLTPVMRKVAGLMADAVEENFDEEGRPKWPALKESTIKARQAKGYWPGKILQRTGGLAMSITRHSDATSAIVGSNKAYAAIHQFGGRTPARIIRPKNKKAMYWPGAAHPMRAVRHPGAHIPARPFLSLGEDDLEDIRAVLRQYLAQAE